MPIYKNLDKLKQWLDENMKRDYDLDACLEDLLHQHDTRGGIGLADYELSGCETKSGKPQLYWYEYEAEISEDGDVISEAFIFLSRIRKSRIIKTAGHLHG